MQTTSTTSRLVLLDVGVAVGVGVTRDNAASVPLQYPKVPVGAEVNLVGIATANEAPRSRVLVLQLDPVLPVDPREARQVDHVEGPHRAPVVGNQGEAVALDR